MPVDPNSLVATRRSWQALAEHVLCPARHAATGKIGLRATPGGFVTPAYPGPAGQRTVAVHGGELVVVDRDGERRTPITSVADAAAFVGIEPGAPTDVFTPTTPLEPDASLTIDPAAAEELATFFNLVDDALARLRIEAMSHDPAEVQLWPEHFDLATSFGEVNYGGSPGDDDHDRPYLYIGPWSGVPDGADPVVWNEPWGRSMAWDPAMGAEGAYRFFSSGR